MTVRLLAITEPVNKFIGQESIIEFAARTCYNSQDKLGTDDKFIERLMKRGHHSVIEHISFTFEIVTTRAIANQLERHRLASYSQESTRYCDMLEKPVIEPEEIKNNETAHMWWIAATWFSKQAYRAFRSLRIKKENARAILPLNLETKLVMSCNARELLHVIELRTSPKAQKEIREIVNQMLEIAIRYCPSVFKSPSQTKERNKNEN